jgi:hypothetical protein
VVTFACRHVSLNAEDTGSFQFSVDEEIPGDESLLVTKSWTNPNT